MHPRNQILDLFSTFAMLDGDYFRKWIADPRLRRSMESSLESTLESSQSEKVWSLYWYKKWQSQDSRWAESHLTAYLQESCYWTAQTLVQRLKSTQYTVADCFQIANSEVQRVLQHFAPERGNNLKSYASLVLTNILKDTFRQRQAADICSNWALLRKVSKKRVVVVLFHTGVAEPEASQYQLAWRCFQALYVPSDNSGGALPNPDARLWHDVALLYNTKRQGQLTIAGSALTSAQIESRLNKLAEWIRAYLYPSVDSLNRSKSGQEVGELQDDLSDPISQDLLDQAIEQEDAEQRSGQTVQIQAVLNQALETLEPELQEILQLFYQQKLSQQELASHLKTSQPTVSRRIKKAEEKLLKAVLDWQQSELNQFPDPNALKSIGVALRSWLITYYDRSNP